MSTKKLIINVGVSETRIVLMEDGRATEFYVERESSVGMVGNIYKAKVSRVLPGMQSAFVNIGGDRSAFLYGGDVIDDHYLSQLKSSNGRDVDPRSSSNKAPIESILKDGDEVMVQVAKEPLGTKGPRVTMLVTVPGRYLVLMPDFENVGISRRIEDGEVRQKLESIVESIRPKDMGVIVRTAAMEASQEMLEKDLEYLQGVWENVKKNSILRSAPSLLYKEPDLILKTTRDLYAEDVSDIIVDDPQAFSQLKHFLQGLIPGADSKLKLYDNAPPILDYYGVEMDLSRALSRKVWLPSGGYVVVDQTEALTSFDVNTGKFVGSHNARETILKTNIEAAVEVVHQLRLRNLGGIIIIDFIDMDQLDDQKKVNETLEEALKCDKSRTNVLAINELGLVQMTRKRTRESLERILTSECDYCNGTGRVLSNETSVLELARDIERYVLRTSQKSIHVHTRQDIIDRCQDEERDLFQVLKEKYEISIDFTADKVPIHRLKEALYDIKS